MRTGILQCKGAGDPPLAPCTCRFDLRQQTTLNSDGRLREALRFAFAPEGTFFRQFIMDEVVKSIDALSREQLALLVNRLGMGRVMVPVLLPGEGGRGGAWRWENL